VTRRSKAGGKRGKAKRRAMPRRRGSPPKAARRGRDLDDALQQLSATSEVLSIIRQSPADAQPVLDAIVQSASRLCGAVFGVVYLYDDDQLRIAATNNFTPAATIHLNQLQRLKRPERSHLGGRAVLDRKIIHVPDVLEDREYSRELALAGGLRAVLAIPLMREGIPIGALTVSKAEPVPFSERQIQLLKIFSDQAVIAIENTRLLNELRQRTDDLSESLERQTATSDVLKVISSSPGDLQPVFDAMIDKARALCDAPYGNMMIRERERFRAIAAQAPAPFAEIVRRGFEPHPNSPLGRLKSGESFIHIADLAEAARLVPDDPIPRAAVELGRVRTVLMVPLIKDDSWLGVFTLWRPEVRPFSDKQIAVVQNFAAQAIIAIENTRLLNELRQRTTDLTESLEQQTGTAEVLKVISSSPGKLEPVFESLLANAKHLCGAKFGNLWLREGDALRTVAMHGATPEYSEARRQAPLTRPAADTRLGRVLKTKQTVQIPDIREVPGYVANPVQAPIVQLAGARTMLSVPMLKEEELLGVIEIYRTEVNPFTKKQVELLQNFAAQAVIAIENTRLLNELRESLQQQTATADVLKVISRSTFDLTMVLDTLVNSAARLCRAEKGNIALLRDDVVDYVAQVGFPPDFLRYMQSLRLKVQRGSISGRAALDGKIVHVPDVLADPEYVLLDAQKVGGFRTALGVPLMREGTPIGTMFLSRATVEPFTQQQIELVTTFADQAVIAIENARLLNELRESLQQQTATSEILDVISNSPTDSQPAFDAIVRSGLKLFPDAAIMIGLLDGDVVRAAAIADADPAGAEALRARTPLPLSREFITSAAILDQREIDLPDVREAPEELAAGARNFLASGYRAQTVVPMVRGEAAIGTVNVVRRRPGPLSDKQRELLRIFANQAVIAIENTRLFNELRESLQQQTATADVLKVISRSTFNLQVVLDTLVESATRLCEAQDGFIFLPDGDVFRPAARFGFTPEHHKLVETNPLAIDRGTVCGRAVVEGRVVHVSDVLADPDYTRHDVQKIAGYRAALGVPLLREGKVIGVIFLSRTKPQQFTDKQVELVTTFADQAVLAIENVRLFDEVQARTRELSQSVGELRALGEVGQAINSTLDVETVLTTIVAKAVQLSGTEAGTIYTFDESRQEFRLRATHGMDEMMITAIQDRGIGIGETVIGKAAAERTPVQIADTLKDPSLVLDIIMQAGFRALLAVPLLRSDQIVGALIVRRKEPGEFPEHTVKLLQTFADQSVLTIQNARLFREIEDKSRQLEEASQHKSQFLANMSHELRTPLNAILGYTELMADGAYGEPSEKMRGILKRLEANGRHLLGLINDVLDLSKIEAGQLVLELSDYSVQDIAQTVRSTLEPLAADKKLTFKVELAPNLPSGRGDGRRLTQVLINLVGNAIKFTDTGEVAIKAEANNGSFHVSVRDTGPGISAADQAKLFQEFQQADNAITRKKGGTGLGLAISKRIIEMHGGRIWVESQPGQGSTFTFTLPVIVERQVEAA
jgi:GAF domain-containing protein